jgi:hypothetical protein
VCIYIVFHNCFLRRVAYIHSTYPSQSIILNKICSGLQSQPFEIYGLRRDKNFLMLIFCFLSELSFSSNSYVSQERIALTQLDVPPPPPPNPTIGVFLAERVTS